MTYGARKSVYISRVSFAEGRQKGRMKNLTEKQKNTVILALIIGLVATALLVFWISTAW
jgi:hypothetical protein